MGVGATVDVTVGARVDVGAVVGVCVNVVEGIGISVDVADGVNFDEAVDVFIGTVEGETRVAAGSGSDASSAAGSGITVGRLRVAPESPHPAKRNGISTRLIVAIKYF